MATKNVDITLIDILDSIRGHHAGAFIFNRQPVAVMPALIEGNRRTVIYIGTHKIVEMDLDTGLVWVYLDRIEGADEAVLKTAERLLNFIYNDIVDPRDTTASLQSGALVKTVLQSEALVKTVLSPVSPFLLDTDRGTGSLRLVIIKIDGARIDLRGYRMLHFGGQKSIE